MEAQLSERQAQGEATTRVAQRLAEELKQMREAKFSRSSHLQKVLVRCLAFFAVFSKRLDSSMESILHGLLRQKTEMGRSALRAEDKRAHRRTNGKDERVSRYILMPFLDAEDKINKHFSSAEALLTIEVRRSGGLTGTQNTAETRHY